jgi:AmmeMemoRadiSam system protein A
MKTERLSPEECAQLVDVAERSIRVAVLERRRWRPDPAEYPSALQEPQAAFVTIKRCGRLMGCVGTLAAGEPLVVAVADRARAAALDDPRFTGVRADDLPDLEVSVSVLSPPTPLAVDGYDELVAAIRPGVDGVVIDASRHHATFLPAVWDDLPDPEQFVGALWHKAGIAPRTWPPGAVASRYTAQHASRDDA